MRVELICFVFAGVVSFVVDGGGTWALGHLRVMPVFARIGPMLPAICVTCRLKPSVRFKLVRPKSRQALRPGR